MKDDELLRYSRHILLNEIGIEGQEQLLNSRALVIGAGGLGCTAAMFLASSGVGHISLVDDDLVDLTNLQRQIAHTTQRVGHAKVSSLKESLLLINPNVSVEVYPEKCTPDLLQNLLNARISMNVVLDCTDNFKTRHEINAACTQNKIPLVSGSALRMDGQLTSFDTRLAHSPCYACLFPAEEAPVEESCSTMGVFAPLVGVIGSAQATEALKLLMHMGEPMVGRLALFNSTQFKWTEIGYKKNSTCVVCSQQKTP